MCCFLMQYYSNSQGQLQTRGRPIQASNLAPLRTENSFKFQFQTGLAKFLKNHTQIVDNFRRNSFACGNLSLPAIHCRLFQRRLSVLYSLVPLVSARPARLSRPQDGAAVSSVVRYVSVSTSQCEFVLIRPLSSFTLNKSKSNERSRYILKIFVLSFETCCIHRHMHNRFKLKVINFINDDHCIT